MGDSKERRKARGAFFTPPAISRYLANWAIQAPSDTVLEPSCGEAGFLLEAAKRLESLGKSPSRWDEQLHGVEVFEASAAQAHALLNAAGYQADIKVCDFFEHDSTIQYDAVVGNPPFVRYQNFTGIARAKSLEAALRQGVRLSGLASSWAAFVIKASLHVKATGRLALVLPAELLSVGYAAEVRRFLLSRFARVRLITFEERVFPEVSEEVVLLLAEGTGSAQCFELHQTRDSKSLSAVDAAYWTLHTPKIDEKWTPALVTQAAFTTYRGITASHFEEMSAWGRTYLGAVTGNNKFFTLTMEEISSLGLYESDLVRILPPGSRHMRGLTFTEAAWKQLTREGLRCYLLAAPDRLSSAAQRYIDGGGTVGISEAYKCRMRSPWWRVPLVETPDIILTYMNHDRPRFVTNNAQVDILNSVYGVRLREGRCTIGKELLPIASLNSVTLLGAEIVGRAYGGGLLKMEPREADKLPLPSLDKIRSVQADLRNVKPQLAKVLRNGDVAAAVERVDAIVLADVPKADLEMLRVAREMLFERRRQRGKSGEGRQSS